MGRRSFPVSSLPQDAAMAAGQACYLMLEDGKETSGVTGVPGCRCGEALVGRQAVCICGRKDNLLLKSLHFEV